MIENILIMDTETTGFSPKKGDKLIEIGAILYNVKYKEILQNFSTLLPCEENPVEKINHIKAEVTQCNYSLTKLSDTLIAMADCAQACVAHNAEFDKKFLSFLPCSSHLLNMKWICTHKDFAWPFHLERFRLQDICFALRIPYTKAHRALSDCHLLANCFSKVHDLEVRINSHM